LIIVSCSVTTNQTRSKAKIHIKNDLFVTDLIYEPGV